jgi:hypothetical protein
VILEYIPDESSFAEAFAWSVLGDLRAMRVAATIEGPPGRAQGISEAIEVVQRYYPRSEEC